MLAGLHELVADPPDVLVVGQSIVAAALAQILGGALVAPDEIGAAVEADADGRVPLVFQHMRFVFLVVADSDSPAVAVQRHDAVREWIEQLSVDRECHEASFVFVLIGSASSSVEEALAAGMGLQALQPDSGYGVWRASDALDALLDTMAHIVPADLVTLRARRIADERGSSLARLLRAASDRDVDALRVVAEQVRTQFAGGEHVLDWFCQPPAHPNGTRLREWLENTVTNLVTQDDCATAEKDLRSWIRPTEPPPRRIVDDTTAPSDRGR